MRAGRIIATIVGALLAVIGLGALAGGGVLVAVHATQRDATGFYQSPAERLDTSAAVLVSRVDLGGRGTAIDRPLGTVRVNATPANGSDLFVGVAPAADVDGWLAGTRYARVTQLNFGPGSPATRVVDGDRSVTPPDTQSFWVASVSGPGEQSLTWRTERGDWAVVVMNVDARPGVAADVSVGARTGVLLPVGILAAGFGLAVLVAGLVLMLTSVAGATAGPAGAPAEVPGRPGAYPVRLDGRLDPRLSRWLWLVKWVLVIPHAFVLAFLWLAFVPLTVVAGFAILFTGRYPRGIFEFNVGVLRWTWRVAYYSFSALGTDRYPPFSLHHDPDYPADLTIDYPQRLSRGLVLVKWWLLAIPHYVVVALFTGGWLGWYDQDGRWRVAGTGLVGILVLVAAVVLLVRGAYPRPVFDFVMGMNRWCYRVAAYAALMRDEYPPFRLDNGGPDPGHVPVPQPPPAPAGTSAPAVQRTFARNAFVRS